MKDSFTNTLFAKILPDKENEEVFREAIEIHQLGDEVVERLHWITLNVEGCMWWSDKELIQLFMDLYKSGCILLPKDGVERIRWIALLCLEFSSNYGFDCSGIILPFDFLTEDMFEVFEGVYPAYIEREVRNLRKKITDESWNSVFGE